MSEAAVLTAGADGISTITLNRPKALNALDRNLTLGLRDAVFAAEQDRSVRCLVIRGGEHFMAGGDLKWFDDLVRSRPPSENRIQFERFVHEVHALIISLRRMPKETTKLAARLAAGPTAVYSRTKALLNGSLNASLESQLQREAEAFAQSAAEPDFAEGIRAFVEKRKPQWRR